MCANELMTFDLNELRRAGGLDGVSMRFVVDRAGINDRENPVLNSRKLAKANAVVVVSNENEVLAAYVNGVRTDVVLMGAVHSIDTATQSMPSALKYDGQFVTFDVPLPQDAQFLTLAATMSGLEHHDHVVFSGARLVVDR